MLYANEQADFEQCVVTSDDSMTPPVVLEPATNELLVNPDFAADLVEWDSCSGQQSIAADGIDGAPAVTLSNSGCRYQQFVATSGANYGLSCIGRSDEDYSSISVLIYDSGFGQLDSAQARITNTGDYQDRSLTISAPADAAIGAVTLYADTAATFDSCGLVETGQI